MLQSLGLTDKNAQIFEYFDRPLIFIQLVVPIYPQLKLKRLLKNHLKKKLFHQNTCTNNHYIEFLNTVIFSNFTTVIGIHLNHLICGV